MTQKQRVMAQRKRIARNRQQARRAYVFYRTHIKLLQKPRHMQRYTEIQHAILDPLCKNLGEEDKKLQQWLLEHFADWDAPSYTRYEKWQHLLAFLFWRKLKQKQVPQM